MRLAWKVTLGLAVVVASAAGSVPAASAAPAPSASSCWTAPLGRVYFGNDPNRATFWLSFNTCDRTVRGGFINGNEDWQPDLKWELWVYNVNTGVSSSVWFYSNVSGNIYTAPIPDAGTKSHVCAQPWSIPPFVEVSAPAAKQECTGDY